MAGCSFSRCLTTLSFVNNPKSSGRSDLSTLNTFGIRASCRHLAEVHTTEELQALLRNPDYRSMPILVLGGGSNILFTKDFEGLVILNRIGGIMLQREDEDLVWLKAGGGVNWHEFVLHTVDKGWGGIENLSLIPGTVGASPIQNIGAYGVEIKDTFECLSAVSVEDGTMHIFKHADCRFGYRDSFFKQEGKGRYIITDVTFRLSKHPTTNTKYGVIEQELQKSGITHPTIKDISNAVISIRSSKLPDPAKIGNAGSFFKNPEVSVSKYDELKKKDPGIVAYSGVSGGMKLAAGWLIEQCGWKGKQIGNVGMHRDQALVLVNYGNASGQELIDHARRVQASVMERFGVTLEMEVNIL